MELAVRGLGDGRVASHELFLINRSCRPACLPTDFPSGCTAARAVGFSDKFAGCPRGRRASLAPVAGLERALDLG